MTATQATSVASTIVRKESNISPFLIGSNPRQILQNQLALPNLDDVSDISKKASIVKERL